MCRFGTTSETRAQMPRPRTRRFGGSSRRSPLKDFLSTRLQGACRYDRIARFFSSALLEVAGEALERMTPDDGETCVRVVCNSCLNPLDVQTARAAKWGMHREWCASLPDEIGAPGREGRAQQSAALFDGYRPENPEPAVGHGDAGAARSDRGVGSPERPERGARRRPG